MGVRNWYGCRAWRLRRIVVAGSPRQSEEKGVQLGVEAACSDIKFGQDGLKAVLGSH